MMKLEIHRQLIKKLVYAWFFLSLIIGSIVAFLEFEKIDSAVVSFAQADSVHFVRSYRLYFASPNADSMQTLSESAQSILEDRNFILVEFYDQNKKKILKYALPGSKDIVVKLEEEEHDFLMANEIEYMKVIHQGRIYLKIVTPIWSKKGEEIIGYLEGVYQVSNQEMSGIIRGVVWSIAQVVVVIFLTTLILYPLIMALNKDLVRLSDSLTRANIGMLKVLGGAIAKRDSDTNAHNYRVTIYSICLAEKLRLPRAEIRSLVKGAFLHDIGKIAISDSILLKPGKLTAEEFEIMKTHVGHGVDIVGGYDWLADAIDVVASHHEKYSGDGYLSGLSGIDIPSNARVFAIADVFDALTSRRPYKEPFSYEKSIEIMEDSIGSHFDPHFLTVFFSIAPDLYRRLSGNDQEDELNDLLDYYIQKYFYGMRR